MSASPKSVCVPCRRVFKGEGRLATTEQQLAAARPAKVGMLALRVGQPGFKGVGYFPKRWMGEGAGMHDAPDTCPECGAGTVFVSHTWRPPRRRNDRAWRRIARGDWMTEQSPHGRAPRIERNPNWKRGQRA